MTSAKTRVQPARQHRSAVAAPPRQSDADDQLPPARPAPLDPGLLEDGDRRDPGGALGGAPRCRGARPRPRTGRRPPRPATARTWSRSTLRTPRQLEQRRGRPAPPPSPSRQPATAARTATTADSPSTMRRTCRGVAPTSRSRPSWRRRDATTKPKVLPTTKTAMNSATPDMIPNRVARSASCARSSSSQPGVVAGARRPRAPTCDRDRRAARRRRRAPPARRRTAARSAGRSAGSAAASSSLELAHRGGDGGGVGAVEPADDLTVLEEQRAVGVRRRERVVGHHDDGLATGCPTASRSSSRTRRPDARSRAPVGSSANSTSGRRCSARAIATRCCWPPESSGGRRRAFSSRPTSRSASRTAARSTRSPASRAGSATFS